MPDVELTINEGATANDKPAPEPKNPNLGNYEVTAEKGLFKRGKLWRKGSTIELDKQTAKNFEALGEVKEIK